MIQNFISKTKRLDLICVVLILGITVHAWNALMLDNKLDTAAKSVDNQDMEKCKTKLKQCLPLKPFILLDDIVNPH